MPRYNRLLDHLTGLRKQEVVLTLAEIERVVGETLPLSAWRYPSFWYGGNHLGRLLQHAGWKASPKIEGEQVIFRFTGGVNGRGMESEEITSAQPHGPAAPSRSYRPLAPGHRLHWFEIERVLGEGGFGITYLAQDLNLEIPVAIKEYLPRDFAQRDHTEQVQPLSGLGENYLWGMTRFIEEAKTLARFNHVTLVKMLSVFEACNTASMVMRYETGQTLSRLLEDRGTLTEADIRQFIDPILDGLRVIHETGYIHRDLKPDNIFIRDEGPPLMLDFGSARQAIGERTRTLTSIVSAGYAPYEQYFTRSKEQGPWSDIYSIAAVMYKMVCGRAPISALDRGRPIMQGLAERFVRAAEVGKGRYRPEFLLAIDKGLAFDWRMRPQTVEEWRRYFP